MIKRAIAITAIAICGFALASHNPENRTGAVGVSEDVQNSEANGATAVPTMTFRDDNFVYVMGDEKSRSFKKINPDATLADLDNFLYAKCWNGYLRGKLVQCEPLTAEDARLIDFCIGVQLHVVQAMFYATLDDMTGSKWSGRVEVPGGNKLEGFYKDVSDIVGELKTKFLGGNDAVRVLIRNWATEFQVVPRKVMTRVMKDVKESTGSFDSVKTSSAMQDAFPVADLAGDVFCLLGEWQKEGSVEKEKVGTTIDKAMRFAPLVVELLWDYYEGEYKPLQPGDMQDGARRLSTHVVDLKNKWIAARDEMAVYLDEMREVRRQLKKSRKSKYIADPKTRKYIQNALMKSENAYLEFSMWLDYAMYDIPFSILTYRAKGMFEDCKGLFFFINDNEKKMMDVMSDYCQAICQTEMLKGIRTRYAASGYVSLTMKLKDELSTPEYESFIHECKLYKVNLETDDSDKQHNTLEEIR